MQVALDEKEAQDVAVIEIEKTGKEEALLQIIGDENLFGEQVLVEPVEVSTQMQPDGNGGPSPAITTAKVIVNVWGWPCVRFIYQPTYRVYVSPFYWSVYPVYYKPWRVRPWHVYHASLIPRPHYHRVHTHRVVKAHKIYTPRRRTATVVHHRTTTRVAARKTAPVKGAKVTTNPGVRKSTQGKVSGVKKTTPRTGVKNPNTTGKKKTTTTKAVRKGNGNTVGGKKTTTTKTARKGNGKATVGKKTTTTKVKRKK